MSWAGERKRILRITILQPPIKEDKKINETNSAAAVHYIFSLLVISYTILQITNVCSGILTDATFRILMVGGISFDQQEFGWLKSTETIVIEILNISIEVILIK